MGAISSKPPSALHKDALDFAPGLLAIQERPPAKLPRTLMFLVAALFLILLTWSIFGKLDIIASAESSSRICWKEHRTEIIAALDFLFAGF